jgi:hypothetical protein
MRQEARSSGSSGARSTLFVEPTAAALELCFRFRDTIQDTDERRVAVAGLAYTAINQSIRGTSLIRSSAPRTRAMLSLINTSFNKSAKPVRTHQVLSPRWRKGCEKALPSS